MIGQPADTRNLADHGALLVRRAVLRDDWIADEILELAASGQTEWTLPQWRTLLRNLSESKLTVAEWLQMFE